MSTVNDSNRGVLARIAITLAVVVMAAACGAGEGGQAEDRIYEFIVERDVVYEVGLLNRGLESKDLVLDLYIPQDGRPKCR